ncbi:hypothetical protein [Pseudomonas aeruginosa]|uniref:hypothetical protein n=2 Tax=Pseudomonas aeruginosa TaxID=287 RepID=UPI001067A133|nr:hypothetical protein [Pseudomonas aeruginosa]TEE71836.1 hypothetical protein IPC1495_23845 [Pseudomonas aeruginosa]
MSSTQHQLIKQCATRLRGIVEALDNIHDTSPHRWSTDLDDVHSSAESLLAMINDQASNQADLAQPSPATTMRAAIDVANDRFEVPVANWGADLAGEEERPVAVAYRSSESGNIYEQDYGLNNPEPLMEVDQHERIVGALRAERDGAIKLLGQSVWQKIERLTQERDAALANVDALAVQVLKLGGTISFAHHRTDQAGQVPQAWLDVQAERRRQVEAEGWTPEHDDEHSYGQMARAAACYALAGSSAPNDGTAALLVSLAWPWDQQWWKPSTARRDMVKACALALAEIERLDRAGISQSPQPGATTASS